MSWKRPHVLDRMRVFIDEIDSAGYSIDMGTGTGIFAKILSETNDYVMQMDIRRFKPITSIYFIGAIQNPPIRKPSCSLVICAQVLHYVKPSMLFPTMTSIVDLLANQGKLIIIEYVNGQSYPWVPFHVSERTITTFVKSNPELSVQYWYDEDPKRPKYRAIITKVEHMGI